MSREEHAEVLVVGAGPVGMLTALLLAEKGVQVSIIDEESRQAGRSYACALHPRSLKLLDQFNLAARLIQEGRRIESLAFYEAETRRAEIRFSAASTEFPFLLVVPQSVLEDALEDRLDDQAGLDVRWNHRLSSLREEEDTVLATIDKLVETARGYSVQTWDWVVGKTLQSRASFVVGADGHNSYVRRALGIEYEGVAPPEAYEVYEFEIDRELPPEAAVVLDASGTSVLWPLPGRRCRWSFQLAEMDRVICSANDRPGIVILPQSAEETRQRVQTLLRQRAPWFKAGLLDFGWSGQVEFEHRLAKQFGRDRSWLAGDSAHQTGPVGMQSMNTGLREAESLAKTLHGILRESASLDGLQAYNESRLEEWHRLLGLKGSITPGPSASAWVRERWGKILPCLPAAADDLAGLAAQLGVEVR